MEVQHNELQEFLARSWVWIVGIGAGVLAKISSEVLMKRKISLVQWLGIVGVSVFFGYMAAVYCDSNGYVSQGRFIVPLITLMGEKITIYISTNYMRIGDAILSIFKKK